MPQSPFLKALRPFSLSVAAITCGLGIALAFRDQAADPVAAWLVMIAGISLQAGVNLINDQADLAQQSLAQHLSAEDRLIIMRHFQIGLLLFALATGIGLYLVQQKGLTLLWIGILGVLGGYFYTGHPIRYKHLGLGVALVFVFMGVLMVAGAYYAVAGSLSREALLLSIPVSLLASLLLLSNELRDYETDLENNIRTLTVRVGFPLGCQLYYLLVGLTFISALSLGATGLIPPPYLVLFTLPLLIKPLRIIHASQSERQPLTPLTGRFYTLFGACWILACINGQVSPA